MILSNDSVNNFFVKRIQLFIGIFLFLFIIKARFIDGDGKRWKTFVETDGKGYYAYLPAIFLYQDLNYKFIVKAEASIYGIGAAQERLLVNGQSGNKYFVGVAILLTPFFLVAWLISFLTGNGSGGYNGIFFSSVGIAALFYLLAGLNYLKKLFRFYDVKEKWIGIILLLLVFTTNIFWYVVYEPSMSHIYSFAAVSAFLYYIKAFQLQRRSRHLVFATIALAIIALIRPVNLMIVLGVPFITGTFYEFRIFIKNIFADKKAILLGIFCFSALAFIQPFIYFLTSGSFLHWPYGGEGFDFKHPHFWDGLFSYRKGLFIYTPVMLVAFLFIIPYFKRSVFASLCYLFAFVVAIWVITSWSSWSYGGAFSLRPVLEFYPLLIIPLAVGLNELKPKITSLIIIIIFLPLTAFCLLQTYQYENHILSYDDMNKDKYWTVFMKTDKKLKMVAYPPIVETINSDSLVSKKVIFYNFDDDAKNSFNTDEFFSGTHSSRLDKEFQFSSGFSASYSEMKNDGILYVVVTVMAKKYDDKNEAALVVSFENPTGQIFEYNSYPLGLSIKSNDVWEKTVYSVKMPPMTDADIMKIYVWNNTDYPLFIDDLNIELFAVKK